MSCEMYTPYKGPDGMLLGRNGKLTMWKSKSSCLSYSIVENLPAVSMMNVSQGDLQLCSKGLNKSHKLVS